MITKISARSDQPGGLTKYLVGPGKANEHTNPHVVAGSVNYPGKLDYADARAMANDLKAFAQLNKTTVKGGHIWHCSIAVGANEGQLGDKKWGDIANDFMAEMGFTDPAKAPVRWTAVHHGLSKAGNDHIHIVASLVRQDGTKISNWQDMPRSQKAAAVLEQRYGLQAIASRDATTGARGYTAGDLNASQRQGHTESAREELDRRVRSVLADPAVRNESDFVHGLRAEGLQVRPYPKEGPVTGYSVARPGDKPIWFGGGTLHRSLSLPKLRATWPQVPGAEDAAHIAWRGSAPAKAKRSTPQQAASLATATKDLTDLVQQIQSMTPGTDPVAEARLAHDLSGAAAAASKALESAPGPLARAARQASFGTGSRQFTPRDVQRHKPFIPPWTMLAVMAMNPTGPIGQTIMVHQILSAIDALVTLRQAKSQAENQKGRKPRVSESDGISEVGEELTTMGITTVALGVEIHSRGKATAIAKNATEASYFGGNTPREREIDIRHARERIGSDDIVERTQREPERHVPAWRAEPMKPNQRYYLRQLASEHGVDLEDFANWTRGQASDAIDAIKSGTAEPGSSIVRQREPAMAGATSRADSLAGVGFDVPEGAQQSAPAAEATEAPVVGLPSERVIRPAKR